MACEVGQRVYHPAFGPGSIRAIVPARDPAFELNAHHVAFDDGERRVIVGSGSLLQEADRLLYNTVFSRGDAVFHARFGYGTVAETHRPGDDAGASAYEIDFDQGVGRRTIAAGGGFLRRAQGRDAQRRRLYPQTRRCESRLTPAERRERADRAEATPAHLEAMADSRWFDLYRHWFYTQVWPSRGPLFTGLVADDAPALWRFIEQRYLDQYVLLLRVCSVPACGGLWPIDYPGGGLRTDRAVEFGDYGIPASIEDALGDWSVFKEDVEFDYAHDDGPRPDFKALDAQGLVLAGEVKRHAGSRVYVEYRPFREVLWIDGATVEAPMPERIAHHMDGPGSL